MHILGDIFDRGPGAHIIMDTLCNYHNFDIQWGEPRRALDGGAAGNDCCIANVLRLTLRYGNLATLEDGYGINLVPLATFAMETYADDPVIISGRNWTKTTQGITRKPDASSHRCTRPSALSSSSSKLP